MGTSGRHDRRLEITALRWLLAGLILLAGSCRFHSNVQREGAGYLQGVWIQDTVPMQDALLQYTLHELKFTCDSVYAVMHVTSKVRTVLDSCYNDGHWVEYAKGVYVVRGDSLLVDGQYTKADWRQKISGCHRSGQFLPRFRIVRYTADSLVLENRYDHQPLLLRKTSSITCVPRKRWE